MKNVKRAGRARVFYVQFAKNLLQECCGCAYRRSKHKKRWGLKMKIINFVHNEEIGAINFQVEHNGEINAVEMDRTEHGTRFTDINDFAEDWTDDEYEQLDDFMDGCSAILYQFRHY